MTGRAIESGSEWRRSLSSNIWRIRRSEMRRPATGVASTRASADRAAPDTRNLIRAIECFENTTAATAAQPGEHRSPAANPAGTWLDSIMKQGLNLSWVAPGLAVGGSFRPLQVEGLRELAVRRVVDVRAENCDDRELLARHGIELLHLPTPDLHPLDRSSLVRGVEWVCDGLERGDAVLVHCEHGIGRSASLACCVLMARGFTLTEAAGLLVRARARVSPSPAQIEALLAWATERFGRAVSWEQLTGILYRPAAA